MRRICILATVIAWTVPAYGDFKLVDSIVGLYPELGQYKFKITFSETPDFFLVDSLGRQLNGFQYRIDPANNPPFNFAPFPPFLINSSDILDTGKIELRSQAVFDPNNSFGGIVASVPYFIHGSVVEFAIDIPKIDIDGQFAYRLFGLNSRGTGGVILASVIPEPVWAPILTGIAFLLVWRPRVRCGG